ncbi:MAG: hypothetical protein AB7Q69_14045 [Gemmatimonadales bacterium]
MLAGTWRNTILLRQDNDVVTVTTTWTFQTPGDCNRTVETRSVAAGVPLVSSRDCTWSASGGSLTVIYSGNTTGVTFTVALVSFSPDALLLGGIRFDRIG